MKKLFVAVGTILVAMATKAQPGAFNPPELACGIDGEVEMLCGTRAPEDFEVTPDGRYLLIANFGEGDDFGLDIFNLETSEFSELTHIDKLQAGWGDARCMQSIGDQVVPHGLSLVQRRDGAWQFMVVNHAVRESMEMYELIEAEDTWALEWHGCVFAEEPYNDVAGLPDGSFIATRPQAIQREGQDLFGGEPTGNVAEWSAGGGETVLPGTEIGYPNGVLVDSEADFAYISGWTTRDFHKYDLTLKKEIGRVDLGFMPDNLTWTQDGNILAAGIMNVQGNCPADSDNPCLQRSVVKQVNPVNLEVTEVFDSNGRALINGTSVAIEAVGNIYVGSFQGTRMIRFPRP